MRLRGGPMPELREQRHRRSGRTHTPREMDRHAHARRPRSGSGSDAKGRD